MKFRAAIMRFYWRMEKRIVPGLRYSQTIFEEELAGLIDQHSDWIDLGCGRRILPPWRVNEEKMLAQRCKSLVGIDFDMQSLKDNSSIHHRVRGHMSHLPFPEGMADLVTANMVVEHLDAPLSQFREVHRILRPGGLFLFHTPNAWGYPVLLSRAIPHSIKSRLARVMDGRHEEDVFPTFYRANTRARISEFAEKSGFEVVKIRLISTTAMFHMFPPLAALELLYLRLLETGRMEALRSNLIVILRRRPEP